MIAAIHLLYNISTFNTLIKIEFLKRPYCKQQWQWVKHKKQSITLSATQATISTTTGKKYI